MKNELSNKAIIILETLKQMKAENEESKVHVYKVLDFLENVDFAKILPEESEDELESIRIELTQKSVSATLTSLVRKGLIQKTESSSEIIDGVMKQIRSYYIK